MKKISLIVILLFPLLAGAQTYYNTYPPNSRVNFQGISAVKYQKIPAGSGAPAAPDTLFTSVNKSKAGLLYYDSTNNKLYNYSGSAWSLVAGSSDTTRLVTITRLTDSLNARSALSEPILSGNGLLAKSGTTASYINTSAGIFGIVSDETGSGVLVGNTSPTFLGSPALPTGTTGVTQTAGNNTNLLATTAFVKALGDLKANLNGPTFTGGVTIPNGSNLGTPTNLDVTNAVGYAPNIQAGNAGALRTASGPSVDVASATAPTVNQVLTALDATHASWQTPSAGGGISGLTTNTVPKATSSTAIGNSLITDNATTLGYTGAVVVSGTLSSGLTPSLGAGTRMLWLPYYGALRAGTVTGNKWDAAISNLGVGSVAFGTDSRADGQNSFALSYARAQGIGSFAGGSLAASGGNSAVASGQGSFAWGDYSSASGMYAMALGYAVGIGNAAATSFSEVVIGRCGSSGVHNTPVSATGMSKFDPIFRVGYTDGGFSAPDALTIMKSGNIGFNTEQKLSGFTIAGLFDVTNVGGTTTANASTTITGTGTNYLDAIGPGDRVSLSSSSSTYSFVNFVTSNTAMTVTPALGNGTSQTINVKKALFRVDNSSNSPQFIINDLGNVGIGTYKPDATTVLDVASTTKGSRPIPSMSTTQKNAIVSPVEGSQVYDLTLHTNSTYNGTKWVNDPITGTGTLVSGTLTISTTAVSAGSVINVNYAVSSGTIGSLTVPTITAGTSFVITSKTAANATQTLDVSTVYWTLYP